MALFFLLDTKSGGILRRRITIDYPEIHFHSLALVGAISNVRSTVLR